MVKNYMSFCEQINKNVNVGLEKSPMKISYSTHMCNFHLTYQYHSYFTSTGSILTMAHTGKICYCSFQEHTPMTNAWRPICKIAENIAYNYNQLLLQKTKTQFTETYHTQSHMYHWQAQTKPHIIQPKCILCLVGKCIVKWETQGTTRLNFALMFRSTSVAFTWTRFRLNCIIVQIVACFAL